MNYSDANQLTDSELRAEIYAADIAAGFERPLTREKDDAWRLGLFPELPPIPEPTYCGDMRDTTIHALDAFERYYGP